MLFGLKGALTFKTETVAEKNNIYETLYFFFPDFVLPFPQKTQKSMGLRQVVVQVRALE